MLMEMKLKNLKDENILILGFGREGKDSYSVLRKLFPQKTIAIADKREISNLSEKEKKLLEADKNLRVHFGKNYLKFLKKYSLVIKSPGISIEQVKPFLGKKQKITSQTEIFFDNCPSEIIGVTGTKGKGTTASLIYQILKEAGFKTRLIGNIGRPVLSELFKTDKKTIFVYEISSHQLKNLKKSPHIAVFLNLFPAHLNFFKNFQDYKKAKENIALFQTENDYFIYNSDYIELKNLAKRTRAKKITFNSRLNRQRLKKILKEKNIPLVGKFNLLNLMAAISVVKIYGVPEEKIKRAVNSFQPLPHRLEFVGKYKKIEFYNDSLATVPEATIAGIETFGPKLKTLIFGGEDIPNMRFTSLAKKILKTQIKTLILLPDSGEKIRREIMKQTTSRLKKKIPKILFASSMEEAVERAYKNTADGVCLLSPGAPSFNLFKDYRERGNLFKKFVKKYAINKKF